MNADKTIANRYMETARRVAAAYGQLDAVEAVALGGSVMTRRATTDSDIDLQVYVTRDLTAAEREYMGTANGRYWEPLDFWGSSDTWIDAQTSVEVDAAYFDVQWMIERLDDVLLHHRPQLGYTTAFWHTIAIAKPLFDRTGWLAAQKERADVVYPPALKQAIVRHNHPVLRATRNSYRAQIEKALLRQDHISLNHRVAEFLKSYFDIFFAINEMPHPGEKRLLDIALDCPSQPQYLQLCVETVLKDAGRLNSDLVESLDEMVDRLDEWLVQHGFNVNY